MRRNSGRRSPSSNIHLGFQIAPMIDVVFVILLFFMVAAGNAQKESDLKSTLPNIDGTPPIQTPDLVEIKIDEAGQLFLNDEALDGPESKRLPELSRAVRDLKEAGNSVETPLEFMISSDAHAKYQSVVNVLDVLAKENITRVTFQSEADE